MSLTAAVSNISRCSVHDGPGVRTVVFFKGCGLRCRWCHNPETLSPLPDILYIQNKCIHCGRCVQVCPDHHQIHGSDMIFLREGCSRCGQCASVCPSGTLTPSGRNYTEDELMKELLKDRHYYQISGGGITLSGGECLLQAEFAESLLRRCQSEGIHTAVETALFVPWKNIERILPVCDLFMADFKLADPEKHLEYTGQDNSLILQNLQRLIETAGGSVLIRIPLIPGVNDSAADMKAFASVLRGFGKRPKGIELLRYNALAEGKYRIAGMRYESFGQEAQSAGYTALLRDELKKYLPDTDVFFAE